MATSTWAKNVSGDWNTASNWTGGVPNSAAADVVIDAPATTAYTVTIAKGATDIVNSVSLNPTNNALSVNQNPYVGAILEVDGTLQFADGSKGALGTNLQNVVLVNGGNIVNGGTIDGFVQTAGVVNFTGTNGIYITNWLQSLGVTTIDTTSIAEYNAAQKTLFDGIFESKGDGATINLGGPIGKNVVDVVTLTGPKATLTPDFWSQLIFEGPTSSISEYTGTAYVPVESTLKTIGESAIVTVMGGRNYTTANPLTIQKDGTYVQTFGTVTTGGLTIDDGGEFSNGVTGRGPHTLSKSVETATLEVTGPITNNGLIESFGTIKLDGAVTGTGSMTFGVAGSTIELGGSVAAGEKVVLGGGTTLILDSPTTFKGSVEVNGAGNTIVLKGVTGTTAVAQGGSIVVSNGATVVDTITTAADVTGAVTATASATGTTLTLPTIGTASIPQTVVPTPTGPTANNTPPTTPTTPITVPTTPTTPTVVASLADLLDSSGAMTLSDLPGAALASSQTMSTTVSGGPSWDMTTPPSMMTLLTN